MLFTCRPPGAAIPGRFPGPVHARGKWFTVDIHCHVLTPKAAEMVAGNADATRHPREVFANARTREVKLACLFTQTSVDTDGRPVRDPDSTSYLGSLAPAAEFATQVHAEARRRGADHIRQLVVLGDGAPWIWNLATAILPEATPIVDLYHAREHLHALAAPLAGVLGELHPHWLAARLADLGEFPAQGGGDLVGERLELRDLVGEVADLLLDRGDGLRLRFGEARADLGDVGAQQIDMLGRRR